MRKIFVECDQNNFNIYLVSLSIDELINNTTVEYYNPKEDSGYQRQLNVTHYRKIAQYLKENENPILPTSILTAIDPEQRKITEEGYVEINGKLRVVDGQHRIEGIKYIKNTDSKTYDKIKDYKFSTIIMLISKENKAYEIESFININKKSKPVKTDLALQLMDKIKGDDLEKLLENKGSSIATKISKKINLQKNSIWYNMIKISETTTKQATISINAFHKSLLPIVENYLYYNEINNIERYGLAVSNLSEYIEKSWEIIVGKWSECFNTKLESYNIQKGIGVYPLHQILARTLADSKGDLDKSIEKFRDIILNSNVNENDWIIGGPFSAYNSKSGFKVIETIIENKKNK